MTWVQVIAFNRKSLPKMVSLSRVKTAALCLLLIISSTAHADEFTLHLESENHKNTANIKVQTLVVEQERAAEEVLHLITETSAETIVSAEDETILTSAARAGGRRVALMPFGSAVKRTRDAVGGINKVIRAAKADAINAFKTDKIGLMIVTYSLGSDVVNWIHADTMSTFTKTSGIIYMLLTTAVLSLNKESRNHFIAPLENMYRRLFNVAKVEGATPRFADSMMSYLGSASLWTIVNAGLIPVLAIDQLAHHSLDVGKLAMPLVIGIVTTAGSFTWMDFLSRINEADHPRAKATVRMLLNFRSATLGTIATTAMLLSSADYGFAPWIAVGVFGIAGWPLYLNVNKIAEEIEASPLVRDIVSGYRRAKSLLRGGHDRCELVF